MAELTGWQRAEQAMERWRAGFKAAVKERSGRSGDREGSAIDDEDRGFCFRAIKAVRCPKCSAEQGERCRRADGHVHKSVVFICNARRHAYLSLLQGDEDDASRVRTSPIVGSTVFVVPVDKQAALVVSKSAQWLRGGKHGWRGAGPLRTRAIPDDMPSMLGVVNGSLLVIGLSAQHSGRGGNGGAAAWICRCTCGYYTLRTTRALRRVHEIPMQCDVCEANWRIAHPWDDERKCRVGV